MAITPNILLYLEVATEVEQLIVMNNGYVDSDYYGWLFPISYGGALYCKQNSNRKVHWRCNEPEN